MRRRAAPVRGPGEHFVPISIRLRCRHRRAHGARSSCGSRVAGSPNWGLMMPEQVWDENPPSGQPGFPRGEGTFSATPLAWTHAQFVRLAWSIDAGRPVERPSIVSCRYTGGC
jgi:hypothetical protein